MKTLAVKVNPEGDERHVVILCELCGAELTADCRASFERHYDSVYDPKQRPTIRVPPCPDCLKKAVAASKPKSDLRFPQP